MMVIKSDANAGAGKLPDEAIVTAMEQYNAEMTNAGVLRSAGGLHSSAIGALLTLAGGDLSVTRGPFGNPEELIGG